VRAPALASRLNYGARMKKLTPKKLPLSTEHIKILQDERLNGVLGGCSNAPNAVRVSTGSI